MDIIQNIESLPDFKKGKRWSKIKNDITFLNLFTRFYNICLNLFKWKNLPETCDVDYLENALFWYGKAIFVNDSEYSYLTLRAMEGGKRNIYRKCINWSAYGFGGYHKVYTMENGLYGNDSVLVRNNRLMFPTANIILEYLYDITDIKRAINVNVNSTKTPTIAYGDVDSVKSLENAFNKISENEALLILKGDLRGNLEVKDSKKEYLADKLLGLKHDMLNELLCFLGINYVNTEKKERLIEDEANSSEMFAQISLDVMLECRKKACEYINKQFGLNVEVEINYDIVEMKREMKDLTNQDNVEVEDNE